MSDERVGPCGEHCAVVDECDARGREITRLRVENEKLAALSAKASQELSLLRTALKPFVKENYFTTEIYKDRDEQKSLWRMVVTKKELDAAAAALKETGDE